MTRLPTPPVPLPTPDRSRSDPADAGDALRRFKAQLHRRLVVGMDLTVLNGLSREQLRLEVRRVAEELCQRSPTLLNLQDRERLVGEVLDETFGLGPLEPLMRDPA